LHNKSYYFKNKPISKELFEQIKNKILKKYTNTKSNINLFITKNCINKETDIKNSENILGNKIYNSKNIKLSFDVFDSYNVNFSSIIFKSENIYDAY
jgi:ADP-ribosylglycohydrolase